MTVRPYHMTIRPNLRSGGEPRSQRFELTGISQRVGLRGVRITPVSGNNSASQAFPGGADFVAKVRD